jgi:CRISPR-associated endonuclease Cas2
MMKKHRKEIIKLAAKEILLSFVDLVAFTYKADFKFRKSANEYFHEREIDKSHFWSRIAYLRKMGYVTSFVEGKEHFVELTQKGIARLSKISLDDIKIARPDNWDGKWRLVIFDIPNEKRNTRDVFRRKLQHIGFILVQESIYVYPFECTAEISELTLRLGISQYVLITISEIIQGEENLINQFLEQRILNKDDLKIT